jgi:LysM repeat protein
MSIRPKVLVQAAGIFLALIILSPGIAYLQEQKEPTAQQQPAEAATPAAMPSTEPANQEPSKSVSPAEDNNATEPAETSETAPAQEKTGQYTIKSGDTLWDISNTFLKDPFLWPFIWKANPLITNPDLIYPGNKLAIPSLAPIERALNAPVEAPKEQKKQAVEKKAPPVEEPAPTHGLAGGVIKPKPAPGEETSSTGNELILPEEQPKPIIDKYSMLRAGYVNNDTADDKIIGSPEDSKSIFGYGDTVYVDIQGQENINVGDEYLIYTPLNTVKHPVTGKRFGKLINVLGILRITAKDSPKTLTAKITLSFDSIEIGSMLTPYQEPALIYSSKQKKDKDITGYILEVMDKRSINAQMDFVYLDKGSADGVEPGDRFIVYTEPEKNSLPRKVIGEVLVFLVKENTSTAVVRKSTDTLARGDRIEYKK